MEDAVTHERWLSKATDIRCFAATAELIYPNVYMKRQINYHLSRLHDFIDLVLKEINFNNVEVVRPMAAGDYYSMDVYYKWRQIAERRPRIIFFGYTKNPYVALDLIVHHPLDNFKIIYSHGGTYDEKLVGSNIPTCYIQMRGQDWNVPSIDLNSGDDYKYIMAGQSFQIPYH